jgi:hypothetical protein
MFPKIQHAHFLAVSSMVVVSSALSWSPITNFGLNVSPNTTCGFFKRYYPNMTLLPSDGGYTAENEGEFAL